MKLKHASFWQYIGKHQNGHDCDRYDPHNMGLKNMSKLFYYYHTSGDIGLPGVANISIGKTDRFGRTIKISADDIAWNYIKALD